MKMLAKFWAKDFYGRYYFGDQDIDGSIRELIL
jgi:hypothetical protein